MKDSDFTKLLTRCAQAARKHHALNLEVDQECKRRYGCSYSDIDADSLIDDLDMLGAEKLTASEFDQHMKNHGAKRIDS